MYVKCSQAHDTVSLSFTGQSIASIMIQKILKRTRILLKPSNTSQNNNEQQCKRWRLWLLVLQNTPCFSHNCPVFWPHGSIIFTRKFISYCANNLSTYWSTMSDLKQQPLTRTSSCLGILAVSVNVLSIQRSAECVLWSRWRYNCPVKLFWLFWFYSWTFNLQHFPRQ